MNARMTFVHALSPLHAGVGQGSGVIDLPIAREKTTHIPFLPGSSLKGALRTQCTYDDEGKEESEKCRDRIFGPSDILSENDSRASLIQITDQRLLLLPVRSLAGTFAWVTSPYVLHRFLRESEDVLGKQVEAMTVPGTMPGACIVSKDNSTIVLNIPNKRKVYLEDLDLDIAGTADMNAWAEWLAQRIFPSPDKSSQEKELESSYWQSALKDRLCLVHDDIFAFLLRTATEIITRIRLEEQSKTVMPGGLWYEEALPAESILTGIALVMPQRGSMKADQIFPVLNKLTQRPLQLGGKATIGRGLCNVRFVEEK